MMTGESIVMAGVQLVIPGILNKRDIRLRRHELTEKDIAQIHGLDRVEPKVCKDKIIGKIQIKIRCGLKVVDGYCKRYLFHGQRRSHYVFTEDQPLDDDQTWKHQRNWLIGQYRMVNGYSNYLLSSRKAKRDLPKERICLC